jgi:hypothetical protein
MKITLAVVLALCLPVSGGAQDSLTTPRDTLPPSAQQGQVAKPATPGMELGVIYLVEGVTIRKLEGVPLDKDKSVGGLGALVSVATLTDFTGEQFWGVLAGPTSEVRLSDPQPRFRLSGDKAQAYGIRIGKFALAGKRRRARIDTTRPVDFFDGKYRVGHQVTKLGDNLWELQPTKALKPGEYALCLSSNGPAVDFTIVAEKGKK